MRKKKSKKSVFIYRFTVIILPIAFLFTGIFLFYPNHIQQYAQTTSANVSIVDFAFSPQTVTIPVGGTVTWTNQTQSNPTMHTTTSDIQGTANSWDSGLTQAGQSFSKTFTTVGTYTYHCNVHTFMRGTITVVAAATPTPTSTPIPTPTFTPVPTPTSTPVPTATTAPTPTATPVLPTFVCMGSCPTETPVPTATTAPTPTAPSNTPTTPPSITQPNNNLIAIFIFFLELILRLLSIMRLH